MIIVICYLIQNYTLTLHQDNKKSFHMVFGTTTFKCDECGNKFIAPAAEWCATCFIAPMPCPKCGSMHTYPAGLSNLGGVFGPNPVYRKIWESIDKKK